MQMIEQTQKLIKQFVLFIGIGAINTGVSLLIILILSQVFGVHYMVANFSGYIIGLGIGFVLHSQVTFKNESRGGEKTLSVYLGSFAFIFCVAYLCQLLLLYVLVDIIKINDAVAQVMAVGMYTIINFAGNKFWTFK